MQILKNFKKYIELPCISIILRYINIIFYLYVFYVMIAHTQNHENLLNVEDMKKDAFIDVIIEFEIMVSIILVINNNIRGYIFSLVMNIFGLLIASILMITTGNAQFSSNIISYLTGLIIILVIHYYSSKIQNHIAVIEQQKKNIAIKNIELTKKEVELKQMAYYDSVTKVFNRNVFVEMLDITVDACLKNNKKFYVVFLDIDNFKTINDTIGHFAGDFILKDFSKRILLHLNEEDVLGRIGGDEFGLIINRDMGFDEFKVYLDTIRKEVNKPFCFNDNESIVSASFGVSTFPKNGTSSMELLKSADIAMYQSKNKGKNQIVYQD